MFPLRLRAAGDLELGASGSIKHNASVQYLHADDSLLSDLKGLKSSLNSKDILQWDGSNLSSISENVLKQGETKLNLVYHNPLIYADASPPSTVPDSILNVSGYNGWYFTNKTVGSKINWYMPSASSTFTVADLKGLYLNFYNVTGTEAPFIAVYTKPTGTGDSFPNFFKSRRVYTGADALSGSRAYLSIANLGANTMPKVYGTTLNSLAVSTTVGSYNDSEVIAFFAINSNSGASVNAVNFILSKFGVILEDHTEEFSFMPLGAQGEQGIQGIQGPPGADGATGATGATGPAGADGAPGADGVSADLNNAVLTGIQSLQGSSADCLKQESIHKGVAVFNGDSGTLKSIILNNEMAIIEVLAVVKGSSASGCIKLSAVYYQSGSGAHTLVPSSLSSVVYGGLVGNEVQFYIPAENDRVSIVNYGNATAGNITVSNLVTVSKFSL